MDADFLLIRGMKNGDEAAIDAFVRKYYPSVLNYCRYRVWDTSTAEDLTQIVFEKFFRSFSSYRHQGKLANYLYVIAGNVCKDYIRQSARHAARTAEIAENQAFYASRAAGTDNSMDRLDQRIDIGRAVKALPDELQEVIILHYFLDKKQKEIAEICGISLPLVKYRLKQAKDKLKEMLTQEAEYEAYQEIREEIGT